MSEKLYKQAATQQGYITTTPIPNQETLSQFYRDLYYQAPQSSSYQEKYPEIEIDYKKMKFNVVVHAIKSKGITSGNLLDIGAGEGFMMQAAHDQGFSVTGIDFSSYGVEKFNPAMSGYLRSGDVYEVLTKLASEQKTFSAISAVNVLEHVVDPDLFLEKVVKIMAPGGLLSVTVPNDFSILQKLALSQGFIDREFWFAPPAHLQYFNTENLERYCRGRGFDVIDAFADFPIDIFLLHPGSNYIMTPQNGPAAHKARMLLELMIADRGFDNYLAYYRTMFTIGLGRDITVLLKPRNK